MKVFFLGTGTSGCVPSIGCLLNPNIKCQICPHAYATKSFNHRLNTCLFVQKEIGNTEQKCTNLLIDCGKTFLWSSMNFLPKLKVTHLNALLLTHPHADAMLGLDDLRGWTMNCAVQSHIHIYCDKATLDYVSIVFPYMIDKKFATGGGDVPSLIFHQLETECIAEDGYSVFKPFEIDGVRITPFHVQHGYFNKSPFYSVGYVIDDIVYISDISTMPERSMKILSERPDPWRLVICDALHDRSHPSHFSFKDALEFIFSLCPRAGLLTGFTHRVDHWFMQKCVDEIVQRYNDKKELNDEDYKIMMYDNNRSIDENPPTNAFDWTSDKMLIKLAYDGLYLDVKNHGGIEQIPTPK